MSSAAPLSHLRPAQHKAAQAALEQLSSGGQAPKSEQVAAWAKALWTDDGTGVTDPTTAARALQAFCDLTPKPNGVVLGQSVLSAKLGGLQLRSAANDDGADWRDKIDLGAVDARLVALDADLEWVFGLDLTKVDDFRSLGEWIGNVWADKTQTEGASWTSDTVQYVLFGALAARHGIPKAIAKPYLKQAFTDDADTRKLQVEMFRGLAGQHARGVFERSAKFEAFLDAAPKLLERIGSDRLEMGELKKQLETELGLAPNTIDDREFKQVLDQVGWSKGETPPDRLTDRGGTIREIAIDHVLGEVTANRVGDALLSSGLADQLDAQTITDADAITTLEKMFGVPAGGVEPNTYRWGKDKVPQFRDSRATL